MHKYIITKENWNHNINVNEFYSLLHHVMLLRVLFITISIYFKEIRSMVSVSV